MQCKNIWDSYQNDWRKTIMKQVKKVAIALAVVIVTLTATAFVGGIKVSAAPEGETRTIVAEESATDAVGGKAISAALAIGLAALGGAIAMGMSISKSNEGIARQPEAEGSIRTLLMLGLVFIETVVIYALIVAILIIFVM